MEANRNCSLSANWNNFLPVHNGENSFTPSFDNKIFSLACEATADRVEVACCNAIFNKKELYGWYCDIKARICPSCDAEVFNERIIKSAFTPFKNHANTFFSETKMHHLHTNEHINSDNTNSNSLQQSNRASSFKAVVRHSQNYIPELPLSLQRNPNAGQQRTHQYEQRKTMDLPQEKFQHPYYQQEIVQHPHYQKTQEKSFSYAKSQHNSLKRTNSTLENNPRYQVVSTVEIFRKIVHSATKISFEKLEEILTEEIAQITDSYGNTFLHCFIMTCGNKVDKLRTILQTQLGKKFVNRANYAGDTPYHVAANLHKWACLKILLHAGARNDIVNESGLLPEQLVRCRIQPRYRFLFQQTENKINGISPPINIDENNQRSFDFGSDDTTQEFEIEYSDDQDEMISGKR